MPKKDSKKVNNKRGGQGDNICVLTNEDVANWQLAINTLQGILNKCGSETPASVAAPPMDMQQQMPMVPQQMPLDIESQLPMQQPMQPVNGGNRKSRKNNNNKK